MLRRYILLATFLVSSVSFAADSKTKAKAANKKPSPATTGVQVEVKTTMGTFVIELDTAKAPISSKNFLAYVAKKHYDGTVFHRVIDGFMIQGGGFMVKGDGLEEKPSDKPIKNEGNNGLSNKVGTLAMARTSDPNSATAQFFVNVKDNDFLDAKPSRPGYAVFGKVVKGMDVVTKIKSTKTGSKMVNSKGPSGLVKSPFRDVPEKNVVIESMKKL